MVLVGGKDWRGDLFWTECQRSLCLRRSVSFTTVKTMNNNVSAPHLGGKTAAALFILVLFSFVIESQLTQVRFSRRSLSLTVFDSLACPLACPV